MLNDWFDYLRYDKPVFICRLLYFREYEAALKR